MELTTQEQEHADEEEAEEMAKQLSQVGDMGHHAPARRYAGCEGIEKKTARTERRANPGLRTATSKLRMLTYEKIWLTTGAPYNDTAYTCEC
jgi:hypothetical protein